MVKYKTRRIISRLLIKTGLINLLWKYLPNGIYVFNYHRIGNAKECRYDRGIFSCDPQSFGLQLVQIEDNFTIISSDELEVLMNNGQILAQRYAVITFDDGYLDCYQKAFPILLKHKIKATFFITTAFVESNKIPWWDEIAYILRQSLGQPFRSIANNKTTLLTLENIDKQIELTLFEAKRLKDKTVYDVLKDLRKRYPEAATLLEKESTQLFMDWRQLNEMTDAGMIIGSHTVNHSILAKLPIQQQRFEIVESKHIIEANLNSVITSIAYPVGRYHCFNEISFNLVKEAGYQLGFNNEPGKNKSMINPFSINRICIENNEINNLKMNCILND